ncbi:MAG: hypothetical protein GPJ52_01965 [Candidatus Heimdallarchaeota archaeon]|nr:hypothetical protein [Candidatus Heimdallarchaeota archaeon]
MSELNARFFEEKYEEWMIALRDWHSGMQSGIDHQTMKEKLQEIENELYPLFAYHIQNLDPIEICKTCISNEVKA